MRVFYWSAFFGDIGAVKMQIETMRWSPLIKAYLNQSCLSGAIRNKQVEIVDYIFSVAYRGRNEEFERTLFDQFHNKDFESNTALHFCYLVNNVKITTILRENGMLDVAPKMNARGFLPTKMRHAQKETINSDEEDSDDPEESEQENVMLEKQLLYNSQLMQSDKMPKTELIDKSKIENAK